MFACRKGKAFSKSFMTRDGKTWSVTLPAFEDLPLYVFALCRYKLGHVQVLERGETSTFTLNSKEHAFVPEEGKRRS